MRRTLSTIDQLGVANGGLYLAVNKPNTVDLLRDMYFTLLDPSITQHYLELLDSVDKEWLPSADFYKNYNQTLTVAASTSTDKEEFEYLMRKMLELYNMWKGEEPNADTFPDDAGFRKTTILMIAGNLAARKSNEWAAQVQSRLQTVDSSLVAGKIFEALMDGSWFSGQMWRFPLRINQSGGLELDTSKAVDDYTAEDAPEGEWQEFFTDESIIQ